MHRWYHNRIWLSISRLIRLPSAAIFHLSSKKKGFKSLKFLTARATEEFYPESTDWVW
jgi:GT2 family glycosyltransferase